jgi:NAD(P)H-dependent FMN reductase
VPDLKIAIILGSTRPGRNGKAVADWVTAKAASRTAADYELVDLIDHPLPHIDEAIPPSVGQYAGEHTKAWAETIGAFDGFIFVSPEYNHSTSGVLKNAIDYLYAEWNNKAAAFVSYGALGGRARSSTCARCAASSRSRTCASSSASRCSPTSRTSRRSRRAPSTTTPRP